MAEIAFKNGRIAYDVIGPTAPWCDAAPGIVFVHGIGADRNIWSDWRQVLAPGFRTVALELPGHGRSFRPDSALDWQIDDLADMVHAVAEDAQLDRYILIGESIGGTMCLVAATGRREVAAVVTCSTAHIGGTLGHVQSWRQQIADRGFAAWSDEMIDRRFFSWQTDAARRQWFAETQCASDSETILQLADILVGLDHTEHLADIICPVLLIHPDSSPFIPLDVPVRLKQGLPNSELMVIPGARHGIACSHGAECADHTVGFLQRRQVV